MKPNLSEESTGFLVAQAYRKIVHLLFQRLKEYDITPEQWSVLYKIAQMEGINQKEIALRTAKDQPTITRILDALIKKGWIDKQMSQTDRRAYLVYVTDAGRAVVERTKPIEQGVIHDVTAGIEPEQLELLRMTLIRISENADQQMGD
ncbi:MAG: MarR family transcriptional regulator [Tumebacillaceae bacterium]